MKTVHIVFTIIMLVFAALQWNDPDRIIWISVYVATAFMAMLAALNTCQPCVRAWATMLCIITFIMMTQTFQSIVVFLQNANYHELFNAMTDDKPYIEQTREFLGLLIVLLYCLYVIYLHQVYKRYSK